MRRYYFHDIISTALILAAITLLMSFTQALGRIDNVIYDIGQRLFRSDAPNDLIIVAIDEASLSQIGRWPWPRETHAILINQLKNNGATAIGLDIIFSEADSDHPQADAQLAQAIASAGNVVLPVVIENTRTNGQLIETLPISMFAEHAAGLGRVHAVLDEDGIARSIFLREGVGDAIWQHFAEAMLKVAGKNSSAEQIMKEHDAKKPPEAAQAFSLARQVQKRISFLGPPGHFKTISYHQVLNGQFAKDAFAGKMVLVGATAAGMNDLLTTPVSTLGQPMAGVEFHANTVESMRRGNLISSVNSGLNTFLSVILALIPLIWLPKSSPLRGLVYTMLYFGALLLAAGLLPKLWAWWYAPAAALLSVVLAYPVWSWRKLEAAHIYLDQELAYLRQHLVKTAEIARKKQNYDVFDLRIAQVRAASQQLRFLQENRKETLAFISHDLRAPIAAAIMAIEQDAALKNKLLAPLTQAHNLAEDFLQASRAEMMEASHFKELDLASLVHQAADDAYQLALNKNITLNRNVLEASVWVNGHFSLLHRAILNLILNAVKFAPAHSAVDVVLAAENQQAILTITDYGPGIPSNEQKNLFKRFSRAEGQKLVAEGAGLGLYFVKTVAEKHQGYVSVKSDMGKPTSFMIHLPVNNIELFDYETA